ARRARTGPAPHFLRRPVTDADLGAYQRHADAAAAAARPFDGVPAMLDALSGAGYRLGPYTSATRRVTTRVLAAAGLAGRSPRRCAATRSAPRSRAGRAARRLPPPRRRAGGGRLRRGRRHRPVLRPRRRRPRRPRDVGRRHHPAAARRAPDGAPSPARLARLLGA